MSQIRVRRMQMVWNGTTKSYDIVWDPVYGGNQGDYLTDINAVIQIIKSRLLLWQEEWWEDQKDGLPMIQKILGKTDKTLIDRLIQKRIAGTPFVTGLQSFESTYDGSTREYTCTATVYTEFGTVVVTNGG